MASTTTSTITVSAFLLSIAGMESCQIQVPEQSATVVINDGASPTPNPIPTPTPRPEFTDRYMFAFSRLRVPSGALVTAQPGTNYVMTRIVVGSPQYATTTVRCHFSGFASTEGGNSPQETQLTGNAQQIDGFWLSLGATRVRAKFNGGPSASVASGSTGVWTDPIEISGGIPAGSSVAFSTAYHTAVGEKQIPVYRIQKHRDERVWGASDIQPLMTYLDDVASPSTAALDTGTGQSMPQYYGPDMCVAKGWDGRPVAIVAADSIGEARQEYAVEADTRGNLGWLRKWLDDSGGIGRIPHFIMGVPGAGSARELTTNALLRWQVLDEIVAFNTDRALPFTVLINQLGQNDLNAKYSAMQSSYVGFIDRFSARYFNVRAIGVGVLPRTSSTDGWATRTGQTQISGNEWTYLTNGWGEGRKWQLEAFKETGANSRLKGYIDTRPFWFDAAQPATWPSLSAAPTQDGVHPSSVSVSAIVAAIPQSEKTKLKPD